MTAVVDPDRPSPDAAVTTPDAGTTEEELLPAAGRSVRAAQRRYLTSSTAWRARDITRSMVLWTLGLLGGLLCWYGAAGEDNLRDQVPWILGAAAATGLFVLGGAALLIAGFREVRRGVRELDVDKQVVFGLLSNEVRASLREAEAAALQAEPGTLVDAGALVAAEGMARAHLPSCLLVRGKQVQLLDDRAAAGLRSCGVCRP